jgi:preprotein translocase subunit SecA
MDQAGDTPIRAGILTASIERAQKGIEAQNFNRRKNVLSYDDVMNQQRLLIYKQRAEVLDGKDLSKTLSDMIESSISDAVAAELSEEGGGVDALRARYLGLLTTPDSFRTPDIAAADVTEELTQRAFALYREKEELFGEDIREVERVALLHSVDVLWMEHIDAMEDLKGAVGLNSYAQRNPLNEFRIIGNDMFNEMIDEIRDRTVRTLLSARPKEKPTVRRVVIRKISEGFEGAPAAKPQATPAASKKVGRNDLCPCGSGKKYKKCCGATAADRT